MRLSLRAGIPALVMALVVSVAAGQPHSAFAAPGKPRIIVPAYVYPYGEVGGQWQLVGEWATLASTPPPLGGGVVVADVCDDAYAPPSAPCGSGDVANPDYVNAIKAVQKEGWTVLGYIDTGYGGHTCYGTSPGSPGNACTADSTSYLESQASAWRSFYGVTGYYFDDVCTGPASAADGGWGSAVGCAGVNPSGSGESPAAFFKQLLAATDSGGPEILNPGTRPQDPAFLSSSGWTAGVAIPVSINVFEGCYSGAGSAGCPASDSWQPGSNPTSYTSATVGISMQVYAAPSAAAMASVVSAAESRGATLLYVTNETNAEGNPYSQPPSYLGVELAFTS